MPTYLYSNEDVRKGIDGVLAPKPRDEEDRLAALHRYGVLDTDAEKAFDDITRLVAHICDTPIALISLVDGNRQWFKSEIGAGLTETPLDVSFCAHAILESNIFVVKDTQQDTRFADNALVTGDPRLRFYAGAQITSPDGYNLGTLCVLNQKPRDLSDRQKEALQILAHQVMSQMELRLLVRRQSEFLEERRQAQEILAVSEQKHRHIAETLQTALLMPLPEDKFPGLSLGTYYQGAWEEAEVAGDFFDAFALADGKTALIIGDVTGKGLIAAAYTAEVKFVLRALLRESSDPALAMARLNDYLAEARRLDTAHEDTPSQYVALTVAVVNAARGGILCAGGGAEAPLIVRADGSTLEIDAAGPLLGVEIGAEYVAQSVTVAPGDLLVMITDGITETKRRNPARRGTELYGYERFTGAAVEAARQRAMEAVAQSIASAARAFSDGVQSDDVCLLLARFQ